MVFSGIIRGYATCRKHRYGGKLNKLRVSHNYGSY